VAPAPALPVASADDWSALPTCGRGRLTVTVGEARGLRRTNRLLRGSDAFVRVALGRWAPKQPRWDYARAGLETHVERGSLAPVWAATAACEVARADRFNTLHCVVWAAAALGDDHFLGEVNVDLTQLEAAARESP
jgi:hypothetical protein